jgi:hypothetical protein
MLKGFKKWLEKKSVAINRRKSEAIFDEYFFIIVLGLIAISFIFYVGIAK